MPSTTAYPEDRVAKAARMYNSTKDAAAALGCEPSSFNRLCLRYGIETPMSRKRRHKAEQFEAKHKRS